MPPARLLGSASLGLANPGIGDSRGSFSEAGVDGLISEEEKSILQYSGIVRST